MTGRRVDADFTDPDARLDYGKRYVDTGVTLIPEGFVFLSVTDEREGFKYTQAHMSPHRARTLAFDLLDAADEAELAAGVPQQPLFDEDELDELVGSNID